MGCSDIKSLNKKLDELSVSILTCMQNIILERRYLEDNLKEGYINLAKSRYLMRGRKISILQINTSTLKSSLKSMSSEDVVKESKYTGFNCFVPDSSNNEESGLKRRFAEDEDLSKDLEETLTFSESVKKEEINSNKTDPPVLSSDDPLRWFGVLVPDTLKNSQMRFVQATKTALKIASLQNELRALCDVYKTVRMRKKELKASD